MLKKHILIAGDSWGCGPWMFRKTDGYHNSHRGLEKFLLDHEFYHDATYTAHTVGNVSRSGGSNIKQVYKIKDYIAMCINCGDEIVDLIFWFQTDPLRDCVNKNDPKLFWKDKKTLEEFVCKQSHYLEIVYDKLNSFGVKVYCIGGCFPLNLALMEKYDNLIPLVHYLPKYILPDYPHEFSVFWEPLWPYTHVPDSKELVLHLSNDANNLWKWDVEVSKKSSSVREYFWPDGRHLNKNGHEKLYEYIKECGLI